MEHKHALEKFNFDLLISKVVEEGEGMLAKYLLPCCCKHESILFRMHNDHVLKKNEY